MLSEIDPRIIKARSALIIGQPFFGSLAMRLIVKMRDDIKTMATDGTYLYYCREFLDRVSAAELLFTIAHEVLHCALSHMTRRNGRRWDLWQAATDYVVNLMLADAGFKVPEWVKYFDRRFAGMNVEEVYRVLLNEEKKRQEEEQKDQPQPQPQPQPGSGGDGDDDEDDDDLDLEDPDYGESGDDLEEPDFGESEDDDDDDDGTGDGKCDSKDSDPTTGTESGDGTSSTSQSENAQAGEAGSSGAPPTADDEQSESAGSASTPSGNEPKPSPSYGDPGGCSEVLDAAPPHDQAKLDDIAAEWQVFTRQATNIARRAGEGKLPGFIEEVINELNAPLTDWRDVFRRFVDPVSNTKDYSWTRPNVRLMSMGYYTPGLISDGVNHIVLAIDSSYSIDTEWLRKFGSESQAALDGGGVDRITVLFADTEVRKSTEYTKGEEIDFTVPGRGGTNFSPTFRYIDDNLTDVSAVIYFTDLDCTDYGPEPGYPVLWAAYDNDPFVIKKRMSNVPFGECIELKE